MSLPPPPAILPATASLFLDFDGTLVDLAARPDAIEVDEGLRTLMHGLALRLDGRLAIVSGRPVERIRQFLGEGGFAVSGSHGVELAWPDGRASAPQAPAWRQRVIEEMERLSAAHAGMLVEVKPYGVALHYRMAPEAEMDAHGLAMRLAGLEGLAIQPGKMMVELREGGVDKGDAVRAFMAEPPMAGSVPIFIGDDLTDEPAFAAAATLGGMGVLVGGERPTLARYRLEDVAAVRMWLESFARQEA